MSFLKRIFVFFFIINSSVLVLGQNKTKTFYFDEDISKKNSLLVKKSTVYNSSLGYGFDYNSEESVKINDGYLYANTSVYFSVKLPEGNYKVDIVFGGKTPSCTTVKAESRRLMIRELYLDANKIAAETFLVNVRTPKINQEKSINIKSREQHSLNWDDKLTLEFLGESAVKSIEITPVENVKTIFLAGDSTVTDQGTEPWASWGQFFTNYVKPNVVVANYAVSGASLSSFKARYRLEKILSLIQKGDYLFIEFAHNDEKIKGEGNGAWGLYTNLLKEFIKKARAKGGIPILCTPTQRRFFDTDETLKPTHGDFPDAMRKVAKDTNVPLIDLTKMTTKMYEAWGVENSKKAFVQYPANTFPGQTEELKDNTHFNSFGANEIAKAIVQGIKILNLPVAKNLKENIKTYNPAKPDNLSDWTVPMSTKFEIKKPDGN